jgi:hypothetical protein
MHQVRREKKGADLNKTVSEIDAYEMTELGGHIEWMGLIRSTREEARQLGVLQTAQLLKVKLR